MNTDLVYASLFDRIIRGEYPAGTWLREDALAAEFDMSRTPVRNVLGLLAQDGLVEYLPKRGSRALGFTVDDLEEAYEIRRVLELLALERSISTIRIEELMEIRTNVLALRERGNFADHADVDARLHGFIAASSGGIRLEATLGRLFRIMQRFRELGFQDSEVRDLAREEHLRLIDAISARDRETAAGELSAHLRNSKARILAKVIRGGLG